MLTTLHTPVNAAEFLRVENEGGLIENNRLFHPVWNGELVNLGLTRSMGDLYFKDESFTGGRVSGLTAEPSIGRVLLRVCDEFVIIASDGFWNVVNPDSAITIVQNLLKQRKDLNFACRQLTEMAIIRGSRDNVTVMLVLFKEVKEPPPPQESDERETHKFAFQIPERQQQHQEREQHQQYEHRRDDARAIEDGVDSIRQNKKAKQ